MGSLAGPRASDAIKADNLSGVSMETPIPRYDRVRSVCQCNNKEIKNTTNTEKNEQHDTLIPKADRVKSAKIRSEMKNFHKYKVSFSTKMFLCLPYSARIIGILAPYHFPIVQLSV